MDTLNLLAKCKLSQNKQDDRRCTSNEKLFHIFEYYGCKDHVVGPCHHGMARPQVADRGTASDKEGSCE